MNCSRIVPDLDGELSAVLTVLEDVLLLLPTADSGAGLTVAGRPLPAPLALAEPAEAMCRLRRAVAASPELPGRSGRDGLLVPDRRYEHLPTSFIEIDPDDVQATDAAVGLLGSCPAPKAVTDAVDAFASDLIRLLPSRFASGADPRAAAICHLERAARVLQVTGSGDTAPDTAALRCPRTLAASGLDVALTRAQEAAY